jgi:hypothetical protein
MPSMFDHLSRHPSAEQRFFRTLNSVVEPAVRRGALTTVAGPGAYVLQTTGRRSGTARRVPVLGYRCGNTIVAGTVRDDSDWVRNIEHDPSIGVWIGGRARAATGTVVRMERGAVTFLRLSEADEAC